MITRLDESDFIPLSDFELAWRFADSRCESTTRELRDQIKPLEPTKARELAGNSPFFLVWGDNRDVSPFAITRWQSLESSGTEDETADVWFQTLPIDPQTSVLVCWNAAGGVAVATSWGTFLAAWQDFWYPFDELCVFDASGDWSVLFGPDEEVRFAEKVVKPVQV